LPEVHDLPRCRPGERPQWVELPREIDEDRFRARARRQRVGVDALAAAAIELALLAEALARARAPLEPVLELLARELREPRLAPTPALRRWELSLAGSDTPALDELPELCLPSRLLQAACPRLAELLGREDRDEQALIADRVAARRGRVMEAYGLELALSSRPAR
jgi:hypothetical protein